MKLSAIAEAGLRSRTTIRDTAEAVGAFIRYVYDNGAAEHRAALDEFLKKPDPRGWDRVKWLIDPISQLAMNDTSARDNIKVWNQLKEMTSPVITAAIYDIDPRQAKGTPLQKLVFSKSVRDKYKLALGPQGYVGTMANVGEIGTNKLRSMLKTMSKSGNAIAKAEKKDMPNIRPVKRF